MNPPDEGPVDPPVDPANHADVREIVTIIREWREAERHRALSEAAWRAGHPTMEEREEREWYRREQRGW